MATTRALHNLHRELLETIEEVGTRRLDLPKEEMLKHTREKGDGARRLPEGEDAESQNVTRHVLPSS